MTATIQVQQHDKSNQQNKKSQTYMQIDKQTGRQIDPLMFVIDKQTNFKSRESIHLKKYLNKVQLKQTKHTPVTAALHSESKQTAQQRDHTLHNPFQTRKLLYIIKANKH